MSYRISIYFCIMTASILDWL